MISFEEKELLLALPKLDSSSGKAHAKAILDVLHDWNLDNHGRLNGACVLLEKGLKESCYCLLVDIFMN